MLETAQTYGNFQVENWKQARHWRNVSSVSTYQYPDRKVEITFFLAERMQGEPEIRVHQQIQWVTASQLPGYDFCPADRDLVAQLSKNLPL